LPSLAAAAGLGPFGPLTPFLAALLNRSSLMGGIIGFAPRRARHMLGGEGAFSLYIVELWRVPLHRSVSRSPALFIKARGWHGGASIYQGRFETMTETIRRTASLALTLGLGLALAACSDSSEVSEKDFGHKWPFTVASGTLECIDPGTLIFHTGGEAYGLYNVMVTDGDKYLPIDSIRRDNPAVPLMKMSLTPIIEEGMALCKEP